MSGDSPITIAALVPSLISAVVSFIAGLVGGLFVERYRQKHDRRKDHFDSIKTVVFAYIQDQLIDHYLRVIDGKEGALIINAVPLAGAETSSADYPLSHHRLVLGIKPPQLSNTSSVASSVSWQKHEETYPHLYDDVKQRHFQILISRFERAVTEYGNVCQGCIEFCKQLSKKLEQDIHLPTYVVNTPQETWVKFPALSLFIYERLWGVSCGTLNINIEQTSRYVLDWPHRVGSCGRGTKEEIDRCRVVVDGLLKTEKLAIQHFLEDAQRLKPEFQAIRIELEKLSLQRRLPGNCRFI